MESAKLKVSTTETSEHRLLRSTPQKHLLIGLDASDEAEELVAQMETLNAKKEPPPRRTITIPGLEERQTVILPRWKKIMFARRLKIVSPTS